MARFNHTRAKPPQKAGQIENNTKTAIQLYADKFPAHQTFWIKDPGRGTAGRVSKRKRIAAVADDVGDR